MKKKLSFSLVAVLMLSVLMMLAACQAKFNSVADYANSAEVQKIVAEAQSDDATCRVFAEGDTLVLEYKLTYDIESQYLSEAANLIKTELDKNPSVFTDVKNEMKVYCNVANPRCVMRYYTQSGTLIIEYEPENY